MSWLEMAAYPAFLLAVFGVYRVGRGPGGLGERFEGLRLGLLAAMMGTLIAIHLQMLFLGTLRTPAGLTSAAMGVGAVAGLVTLHVVDRRRQAGLPMAAAR